MAKEMTQMMAATGGFTEEKLIEAMRALKLNEINCPPSRHRRSLWAVRRGEPGRYKRRVLR